VAVVAHEGVLDGLQDEAFADLDAGLREHADDVAGDGGDEAAAPPAAAGSDSRQLKRGLAPDGERTAFLRAMSSRKKGSSDFILKRVVW
jgi:hypothetical protein